MPKLIIANWKLNPLTLLEAQQLAARIQVVTRHEVVLCPPTAFISAIKTNHLGAQDCSPQIKGPYTGQVSPAQLASLGVRYCLVGHSERRAMGETSEEVSEKVAALLSQKITPVICVGYGTAVQQDELEVVDVIKTQLAYSLGSADPQKVVVAYEPVWAIGTRQPATPEHANQIALYLKTKHHVPRVLYGGSINGTNASSFLSQIHIDGLLVGGASLLSEDFNKIISL